MKSVTRALCAIACGLAAASIVAPALATTAIVVPEPESFGLFAAAVAIGVIAFRFFRRR